MNTASTLATVSKNAQFIQSKVAVEYLHELLLNIKNEMINRSVAGHTSYSNTNELVDIYCKKHNIVSFEVIMQIWLFVHTDLSNLGFKLNNESHFNVEW